VQYIRRRVSPNLFPCQPLSIVMLSMTTTRLLDVSIASLCNIRFQRTSFCVRSSIPNTVRLPWSNDGLETRGSLVAQRDSYKSM